MLQEVWLVTKITRLSKKDNVLVPSCIKIVEITQNQIQKIFIEESPTLRAHRDKANDFYPSWPRIIYTQLFEARYIS